MLEPGTEQSITVSPQPAAVRLDVFLAARFPDLSRSRIQRLIAEGSVSVNDRKVAKSAMVIGGETIHFNMPRAGSAVHPLDPQKMDLVVLYEDEHLLAIDKPPGLVVHPGSGNHSGTLVNGLLHRSETLSAGNTPERPGIVHRLDKETSGVLVVAKTDAAHAALSKAFAERRVSKSYVGVCIGRMPIPAEGTIDLPLARSRRDPVRRAPDAQGKIAKTDYRLIGHRSGISLLRFHPLTGRTHQIRVHCSSRGFPILCDGLYGGGRERLKQAAPLDRPFAAAVMNCFKRHALHAVELSVDHPFKGDRLRIVAPLPDDFRRVCRLFNREGI